MMIKLIIRMPIIMLMIKLMIRILIIMLMIKLMIRMPIIMMMMPSQALHFLNWMKQEPQSMVWLPVLHRSLCLSLGGHQ